MFNAFYTAQSEIEPAAPIYMATALTTRPLSRFIKIKTLSLHTEQVNYLNFE